MGGKNETFFMQTYRVEYAQKMSRWRKCASGFTEIGRELGGNQLNEDLN